MLTAIEGELYAAPLLCSAMEVAQYCAGRLDWDNAYGGLKPLKDCLVARSARNHDGLGLIQDDSPKFIPAAPHMTQVADKRGAGCIVVRIYSSTNRAFN